MNFKKEAPSNALTGEDVMEEPPENGIYEFCLSFVPVRPSLYAGEIFRALIRLDKENYFQPPEITFVDELWTPLVTFGIESQTKMMRKWYWLRDQYSPSYHVQQLALALYDTIFCSLDYIPCESQMLDPLFLHDRPALNSSLKSGFGNTIKDPILQKSFV